jgi:sodium/bile acid cotransporter 7
MTQTPSDSSLFRSARRFLAQRWFLIVLVLVLAVGIGKHERLKPVAQAQWLRDGVVAVVLFMMALPLEAESMLRSLRRPGAALLGFTVNLGLAPLLAWAISWVLRPDAAAGLFIAAITPCTLASATVWTRRAGGNPATAIWITILTNGVCFLITPLWLILLLGERARDVQIDAWSMAGKLAVLVVAPMAAAQGLRLYRPAGAWATRNGKSLSILAQCGVLTMVLIGAINTGEKLSRQSGSEVFGIADWAALVAAVLGLHLSLLSFGYLLAGGLRMPREERIAVGIAGSQKTLMIGLQVALDCGLSILPMIAYHVGQLVVDTPIADRWRKIGEGTATPERRGKNRQAKP